MSRTVVVSLKRIPGTEDLPLPAYATPHSAGMDLRAAIPDTIILQPGDRVAVPTGIILELPDDHEAQVRPRSGLAKNFGVGLVNSPGTIDADYRGEIAVLLINWGQEPFVIERGARIAQLVVAPVSRVEWSVVEDVTASERGAGGFGHTGRQ